MRPVLALEATGSWEGGEREEEDEEEGEGEAAVAGERRPNFFLLLLPCDLSKEALTLCPMEEIFRLQ